MDKKRKRIANQNDFELIQVLVSRGIKNNRVLSGIIHLSPATISRLRQFKAWEDYETHKRAESAKLRARRGENGGGTQSEAPTKPNFDDSIIARLDYISGQLDRIEYKLVHHKTGLFRK